MKVIYPPHQIPSSSSPKVFLAGSIDMGNAPDWQQTIIDTFAKENIVFLNPRRKDWDNSWEQSIHHPKFNEQVTWELDGLELADLIVMYFAPQSQAPVSLLEFGLHARGKKMMVCCPDGFWRKGNIDIVCQRFQIPQVAHLNALIASIRAWI